MPAYLVIERPRYYCRACRRTIQTQPSWLDPKHRITRTLAQRIFELSCDLSFAEVGRVLGISESVVRDVFWRRAKAVDPLFRPRAPRLLGIDEVHLSSRPRAVLTDLERGTVVDVLESYSAEAVTAAIQALEGWEGIEGICIDFALAYASAVQSAYAGQNARPVVVIDKRHVLELARSSLNRVRAYEKKSMPKGQHRSTAQLLNMRRDQMSAGQQIQIEKIRASHPRLADAHFLNEGFRAIYDCPDRASAEAAYDAWVASIPRWLGGDFRNVVTELRRRRQQVFAYFDLPITNAVTETRNGHLKALWRRAKGHRKTREGFRAFRLQVLHKYGDRRPDEIARREAAAAILSMSRNRTVAEIEDLLTTPNARQYEQHLEIRFRPDVWDRNHVPEGGVEVVDDLPDGH
jgi:transposase